ncbi:MAG: sugar phosphate isomerase/epimerase [Anaerolineae bacterium]|nr:sugar phosphate isomerase/epimerase [Anaerolineae bacterium]
MKLGVCADPQSGVVLAEAGFDFIELHVQNHLKTLEEDVEFAEELALIQASPVPALAANCFLPGDLKVTGPEVDLNVLKDYVAVAFERASRAGIEVVVFGSGAARRIPDDFARDVAWQQLVEFGRLIGPVALQHGVTVVVEPLHQAECNVLTSLREAGEYVNTVAHPSVQLLVDSYHWMVDDNDCDAIVTYGHLLRHVHIATRDSRVPPGFELCDFGPFFRALKQVGYDGTLSIEAKWDNLAAQAAKARVALAGLVGA